jgi:hypothetical protein
VIPLTVAAEVGVVFQRLPGPRIVIVADAEQAAEAEHRVRHLAADLVDHHALDVAHLFAVGPVHMAKLGRTKRLSRAWLQTSSRVPA